MPQNNEVYSSSYVKHHLNLSLFIFHLASCEKDAIGLAEGYVLDSQLTASSELNANTPAKNGRLNYTAGSSWCASMGDSGPYLQIDLQTIYIICAVSTQGNSQGDQWVETYTLQSSTDGTSWTDYKEHGRSNIRVHYKINVHSQVFLTQKLLRLELAVYLRCLF